VSRGPRRADTCALKSKRKLGGFYWGGMAVAELRLEPPAMEFSLGQPWLSLSTLRDVDSTCVYKVPLHARSLCMLGNFPQAFSHVGLINTAINLASVGGVAFSGASASLAALVALQGTVR
jgi:hypothetical protein